jgi:flagellar protein FlaG
MNVDTTSMGLGAHAVKPAEQLDLQRKTDVEKIEPQAAATEQKIQPEELLSQIKSVTQDGLYSVRFEQNNKSEDLIVQIFDNATQEVIRQFPAEEILNFKASFSELIGNVVSTKV